MEEGISVIMPTFNQAGFICRALSSLFEQTFKKWELIIINDGCTDETEHFIGDYLNNPAISYVKTQFNRGIVMFLYRYANYAGCDYYREFADKLLDYVMKSVARIPVDFEDGLSGIGWSVNYLIKEGFVDGGPNDVLQDVDKRVFSNHRCNPKTSIFGQGVYLIERLKDNPTDVGFGEYVNQYLDFCEKRIKEDKEVVSLYHINSILFFLLTIEKNLSDKRLLDSTKNCLPECLQAIFKNKAFDSSDLYIFERLLSEIGLKQCNGWDAVLSLSLPEVSKQFDIETMIGISWQETLYFGNSKLKKIPLKDLSHFINHKQELLVVSDFLFASGLAGLGDFVLSSYSKV